MTKVCKINRLFNSNPADTRLVNIFDELIDGHNSLIDKIEHMEILSKPIIDLDNPENNCKKCGYVHCGSTLNEKKEECKHEYQSKRVFRDLSVKHHCITCGENMIEPKEETKSECKHFLHNNKNVYCPECEPKSTLREEIEDMLFRSQYSGQSYELDAVEIISLFKDTLLKECCEECNKIIRKL